MRSKLSSKLWGCFFILFGVLIIGNLFDLWDITLFFAGWWTLIIIIPCIIRIISSGFQISSVVGLTIGILLLLMRQNVINTALTGKLIFPIILIIIGLSVIFKNMERASFTKNFNDFEFHYDKNASDYATVFHSRKIYVPNEYFYGARLSSVFGDLYIDLSSAIITQDVVIHCSSVFGDVKIQLPSNVAVKTSGTQLFGSLRNKTNQVTDAHKATVFIDYNCIFGEITII